MTIESLLLDKTTNSSLRQVAEKVFSHQRLSAKDALLLYETAEIGWLGVLASFVRNEKNKDFAYFNRNFHIEPTNICLYQCQFCSYKRKVGEEGSWEYSLDDIVEKVKAYKDKPVTEVHIVGGVHPGRDLYYYGAMLSAVKKAMPNLHIKAFTAIELDYMIKKAGLSLEDGFNKLREYGLDSIPGGGAEIFDPEVRQKLCPEKSTGERWIAVHKAAHLSGVPSNATILYGHIETYQNRIDHMEQLRNLQDETKGFNAFIPLKYRKENNYLSHLGEVSVMEDLKNYAVARLFLDNIPHIKAYWPMIGRDITQTALSFGVDDIDGTIDDSTKIYTMAGVKQKNSLTVDEMVELIKQAGRTPVERDTLYNIVNKW